MAEQSCAQGATAARAFRDGRPVVDNLIHEGEILLVLCDEHDPAPILASLISQAGQKTYWLDLGRVVASDVNVIARDPATLRRYVLAAEKRNCRKHPYRVASTIDRAAGNASAGTRLLVVDDLHHMVAEDADEFDGRALVTALRDIKATVQQHRLGAVVTVYVCQECNGAYRSALLREANAAIVYMGDEIFVAKDGRRDPNIPRRVALAFEDISISSGSTASFTPVVSIDRDVIGGGFSSE